MNGPYAGRPRRLIHTLLAVLAAAALMGVLPSAAAAASPGASGIGDRLFPGLGNGGYDVQHYDLTLRYATSDPAQPLDGDEVITAVATKALSRFDLDFSGESVGRVFVNGQQAAFTRVGAELVITPVNPLPNGRTFVVAITHFRAVPTIVDSNDDSTTAFFITPDGSATAPQPAFAHLIFPCNDHPRDKATFSFTFNLPAGEDAVANGVEAGHWTRNGRTIWKYEMAQPMATELTQLSVGNWDFGPTTVHHRVPLRDVTAPSLTASVQAALALEPAQLDWMTQRVGRYPFDIFGAFVPDTDLGFALETQTISLIDRSWFTDYDQGVWEPTMLHEMSHMWFGDSVSPYSWSDIWLNEGHASWYEFIYAEQHGELADDTTYYPDPTGYATLDELMKAVYAHGDQWRHDYGPVAAPLSGDLDNLFSYQAYHGGALVLYALRQKIGGAAFRNVEKAWVQTYAGKSASTADFIALASQVSGQDLTTFLNNWLYGTTTPPMPGHPDWTTDPVTLIAPVMSLRATSAFRH